MKQFLCGVISGIALWVIAHQGLEAWARRAEQRTRFMDDLGIGAGVYPARLVARGKIGEHGPYSVWFGLKRDGTVIWYRQIGNEATSEHNPRPLP